MASSHQPAGFVLASIMKMALPLYALFYVVSTPVRLLRQRSVLPRLQTLAGRMLPQRTGPSVGPKDKLLRAKMTQRLLKASDNPVPFWQDLELSDFAIYCQGFAWPAHSCTVCYHSPTILAAFNYCKRRCKPESKPFVIIDEIDPRYLFSCLHFIYYGCKLYRPALFPRQGKGEGELDRPSGDFEYSMGSVFRTLLKQSVPRNDPLHTRTRDNQAAALILDNVQMFIAARILRIQDLMRACLFNVSAAIQYFLIELQLRDVEVIEDEYAYMQGCIGICLCLVYSQPDPGQFIELRRRLIRLMLHMKPSYLWSVVRKQDRFVFLNSFVAVHLDQAMRILSGSDQYETDGYKTDPGSDEPTFSDVADQLSKDPN